MVRPRGPRVLRRLLRSPRCAIRPAACSRSPRCAGTPSPWRSLTPTATRRARSRDAPWPAPNGRCRQRSDRCSSSVSVNPLDTPASTPGRAARRWDLAQAGSLALAPRGTHAELARGRGRAYQHLRRPRRATATSPHTEALYLIDRRGDERSAYLYPFATRFVADDLRTLAKVRARAELWRFRTTASRSLGSLGRAERRRDLGQLARLRDVDQTADHVAARAHGGTAR